MHIARQDLERRDMFKPAQSRYLRTHLNQLPLLGLRPQATCYRDIPSHLNLANEHTYIPYDERYSPLASPTVTKWLVTNSTSSSMD